MKYPLALSSWANEELAAIQKVIDNNMFSMSKNVLEFEKQFASFCGSKYCVMVNSGSSANLAAIASLFYKKENPLKAGDEVIVPAVSWPTTYYPLYQYGLKLKFVDIDRDTLNFNLEALETAISSQTKIIFAVNLLGNPNDFKKINDIIDGRDIIIIEDNCESMGATFQDQQAGTFGLVGTFSSFFSHHISTMEGGLIVTDNEELYHILLCVRSHGWTRNLPETNKVTGKKSSNNFEESFKFVLPGYNLRPLEMSGAIGIEQLIKLPNFIKERRKNADIFKNLFYNHKYLKIQQEIGESSWFGFSFIIKENAPFSRTQIVNHLTKNNIDTRPIVTGNFTKNEVVKKFFNYEIHCDLPNADYLDNNGFFVGNHQVNLKKELQYLKNIIDQI